MQFVHNINFSYFYVVSVESCQIGLQAYGIASMHLSIHSEDIDSSFGGFLQHAMKMPIDLGLRFSRETVHLRE